MKLTKKHFKWVTVGLSIILLLSSNLVMTDASTTTKQKIEQGVQVSQQAQTGLESIKNQIPIKMEPGTILTYDSDQEPSIAFDTSAADHSSGSRTDEVADLEGRAAEDAFFAAVKESVKDLPVVDLGYDLPDPVPGTVVMYGSDGFINHIYVDQNIAAE